MEHLRLLPDECRRGFAGLVHRAHVGCTQPPVECERDSHEVLEKVFDGECAVRQCDGSQDLASRMDRNGQVRRAFRR